MARRTKEQQIADLQAKQVLDVQRAIARRGVDDLKTQLHKRDYAGSLKTIDTTRAAVMRLLAGEAADVVRADAAALRECMLDQLPFDESES